MAEKEKESGQELEEVKPLSLFEERMKSLLDELDEHMAQIGGNYGPVIEKPGLPYWGSKLRTPFWKTAVTPSKLRIATLTNNQTCGARRALQVSILNRVAIAQF